MNRIYKALTLSSLALLAFALGCGHPQTLESITISPSSVSEDTAGGVAPIQFTAYGNFINPVKTVDITNQVTWSSDASWLVAVDGTGAATPKGRGNCGVALLTATAGHALIQHSEGNAVVSGSANFVVTDAAVNTPICGGGAGGGTNKLLTVAVTGAGSVSGFTNADTTATTIIACTSSGGGNCSASLPAGTLVTLEMSVAPTSFPANCPQSTATSCNVSVSANTTVDLAF